MGEGIGEVCTEFWWRSLRGRGHLEDLDLDGRVILKPTLNNMGERGMDRTGSGCGQLAGFCKGGNEH